MSEMERNKGKLIPVSVDTENFTEEDYDTYRENGFMVIDGEIFEVEWEIKGDTRCFGLAEVIDNPDGTIDFQTHHYNGISDVEDIIQRELNKQFKETYIGK